MSRSLHCSSNSNVPGILNIGYFFGSPVLSSVQSVSTIYSSSYGRPGSSEVPRNPLTRWGVSSIPANGIFLTKNLKNKIKMPNGWRTIKSLVHKI